MFWARVRKRAPSWWLNTEDNRDKKLLSGTTIKMVGPAADVTRANGYLSQLQTGKERTTSDGSIRIENHTSDPVGSMPILLGGNSATASENNLNKGWIARISDIFGDNQYIIAMDQGKDNALLMDIEQRKS